MKENIRAAVAEKDEVELPVGVFAPEETPAPVAPARRKTKVAGQR